MAIFWKGTALEESTSKPSGGTSDERLVDVLYHVLHLRCVAPRVLWIENGDGTIQTPSQLRWNLSCQEPTSHNLLAKIACEKCVICCLESCKRSCVCLLPITPKIDISGVFETSALEMMSILHWGNSQSCEPSISPIDSKISSGKLLYEGIGDTVPLIFLMISFGCSIYRNFRVLSQVWKVFSESYAAGLCHYAMFLYKWPPISQANPEDLAVPLCRKRKSQRESFVIFQE